MERKNSVGSLHDEDFMSGNDSTVERSELLVENDGSTWRRVHGNTRLWPRGLYRLFGTIRTLLNTVLLVVILLVLMQRAGDPYRDRHETLGDLTGFAPKIAQHVVRFAPDPMFVPENASLFFSEEVQQKWIDLVPRGLGYIRVEDPQAYESLPTPLAQYEKHAETVFTTSVTHQLHCLHSIVAAYAALSSNGMHKAPHDGLWHLQHCFDYLRQSIMCCSDTALEGEQTTFPDGFDGSDGWDARHVCRDYRQVYEYLEYKRADDKVWI